VPNPDDRQLNQRAGKTPDAATPGVPELSLISGGRPYGRGVGGMGCHMANADGSNISGRGMGMPYGPPNTISLRVHLCHIPLCIGANEPVLEYCRRRICVALVDRLRFSRTAAFTLYWSTFRSRWRFFVAFDEDLGVVFEPAPLPRPLSGHEVANSAAAHFRFAPKADVRS
jgi:hypothetical protein